MNPSGNKEIKIAILDLYEGVDNQGMRCIREILNQFAEINQLNLTYTEYEVRKSKIIPGLEYDMYISSGGPGSPIDSEGADWENKYFKWISDLISFNSNPDNYLKKHVFFICHSFQLACRYFKVAQVTKRKSTSFGVFPMHYLSKAYIDPIFKGLQDPFYAVDSRDYQVIQPDLRRISEIGASILAIEKARPHVPYERAVMALRFNEYMVGTQFHPEADAIGMSLHLQTEDRKKNVIENHGEEKWESMIEQLNDPEKIMFTYAHILPNFLLTSLQQPVLAEV
ncbi:MAG: GMP synthase [Ferruginibacter sp.]|nr:GMP synthase [Ferruginibacter sp.]